MTVRSRNPPDCRSRRKVLADRFAILISIPGVSNITAAALLIAMPELGSLEAGQAANLAGA